MKYYMIRNLVEPHAGPCHPGWQIFYAETRPQRDKFLANNPSLKKIDITSLRGLFGRARSGRTNEHTAKLWIET